MAKSRLLSESNLYDANPFVDLNIWLRRYQESQRTELDSQTINELVIKKLRKLETDYEKSDNNPKASLETNLEHLKEAYRGVKINTESKLSRKQKERAEKYYDELPITDLVCRALLNSQTIALETIQKVRQENKPSIFARLSRGVDKALDAIGDFLKNPLSIFSRNKSAAIAPAILSKASRSAPRNFITSNLDAFEDKSNIDSPSRSPRIERIMQLKSSSRDSRQ